jgi:deazaflavin-dependent oxidoreductase (nitroreductase family)
MYDYEDTNLFKRVMRNSGSWPGMWRVYAPTLHHLDRIVYRFTDGRSTVTSWLTGLPIVQLTTVGAKSGLRRTLPLVAIPHEDGWVVIASNFGQPRHPAWYYNLRANPQVTVSCEGQTREMSARELEGEERDRWYERGIQMYPGWTSYRERTAAYRRIPVIELMPAASASTPSSENARTSAQS